MADQSLVETVKVKKLEEVINLADKELESITGAYPHSEQLSWGKQESEARLWLADNTADTPLLDSMAQSRGVTKQEAVNRVLAKAVAFAQLSGAVFGHRQKLTEQVESTTTIEEVEAVEVDYSVLTQ